MPLEVWELDIFEASFSQSGKIGGENEWENGRLAEMISDMFLNIQLSAEQADFSQKAVNDYLDKDAGD